MVYITVHCEGGENKIIKKELWPVLTMKGEGSTMNKMAPMEESCREVFPSQESMNLDAEGEEMEMEKEFVEQTEGETGKDKVTPGVEQAEEEASRMEENKEAWKQAPSRQKHSKKNGFYPAVTSRQSTRSTTGGEYASRKNSGERQSSGMFQATINSFTILNSCENDELEDIATLCDIKLGESSEEAGEIINAMKLEELARAAIAEAKHRDQTEKILVGAHALDGENLELQKTDNSHRGFQAAEDREDIGADMRLQEERTQKKLKEQKRGDKGSKLSRELKRISLK